MPVYEVATPGRRVAAYLIDGVIAVCLVGVISLPLGAGIAAELFLALGVAAYDVVATAVLGTTVGKRLFKLRISSAPNAMIKPSWGAAAKRAVIKWAVPFTVVYGVLAVWWTDSTGSVDSQFQLWVLNVVGVPGLLFPLAVLVTIVANGNRRGWHDLFAGTFVIRSGRSASRRK